MSHSWTFVVTDLQHTHIGELKDYFDMNISRRLNGVDSGSFRVRADHPMFVLLSTQKCYVKGYRDGVLQAFMYVWSVEISGDGDKVSLAVTLASPAIRLDHVYYNFVGSPAAGGLVTASPEDRYQLFHHFFALSISGLIKLDWATAFPSTPIPTDPNDPLYFYYQMGTGQLPTVPLMVELGISRPNPISGSTMLYDDTDDRTNNASMAQRLQTFSQGSVGFDWYWEPTEPRWWYTTQTARNTYLQAASSSASMTTELWTSVSSFGAIPNPASDGYSPVWHKSIATLQVGGGQIGDDQSSTVYFEYGVGKHNLTSFKLSSTRQYQATQVTQRLAGQSTGSPYYQNGFSDNGAALATWGQMQDVSQFDVDDETYLQQLLDDSVRLRRNPMRRLEITPLSSYGDESDVPDFGVDFSLGDLVSTRIHNPGTDLPIVDGQVRVHGVAWTIKPSGAETMAITIDEEN